MLTIDPNFLPGTSKWGSPSKFRDEPNSGGTCGSRSMASLFSGHSWMYPECQRTPSGYLWVKNLQESLENTINTMGTLLGVQPIVP